MNNNDKSFYIKYLACLIELNKLHSMQWEGKTIITPTLISENLCKYLLGLEDREKGSRDHDAKKDGKKYEIKATSKETGDTTYNPNSKVEYFIWIFFDYINEELVIKKTEYKNIKQAKNGGDNQVENDEEVVVTIGDIISTNQSYRKSIRLKQIHWEEARTFCMRTLKELKKEKNNETSKI